MRALAWSAGLALGLLLAIGGAARVEARVRSDSSRVVGHVRVDPSGVIQVEESGRGPDEALDVDRGDESERDSSVVRVRGVRLLTGDDANVIIGDSESEDGVGLVIDSGNAGLVRIFSDVRVPAGRTVQGGVVAVFGSVEVEGTVTGDVVAAFGSLRLRPGAVVMGDAVAIGGVLDHATGARVEGESLALGFFTPAWKMPTLATLFAGVLLGWLLTLFLGWLLSVLFRERMLRVGATASRHTAVSFFLGLLSAPLFVIALVLLFVTVVGIPFALVLPILYLLMIGAGQVAASYVLGCKLLRRRVGEGGLMGPITMGTLLVTLLFVIGLTLAAPEGLTLTPSLFFGLLGALLVVGLSTIGTGAVLLSRLGSRSESAAGVLAPAAPSAPASPPTIAVG